jgi:hypothetical protein
MSARPLASLIGPLLAALLLLAASARADDPPRAPDFRELSFPAGKRIIDRILLDLDQDGAKDLLLVRGREVSLFLQKGGAFLPERPDQKFNFVSSAILWDEGDIDGDLRPEILFLTGEGVSFYRFREGRLSFVPERLLSVERASILSVASPDEIRYKDFFTDVTGDGVPDLLLPGEGCYLLYRGRKEGGFLPPDILRMRPEVWLSDGGGSPTSQVVSSYWYPQPVSGDFDGDGGRDIFVHQREQVAVFLRKKEGGYGPDPSMALPLTFEGELVEGRFKLDIQLPTKFADVDGDGLTDIVATHIGRGTTYVFRGRKDRKDLKSPDVILKLPGISFLDFMVDLDHDGRQDLVLGRTDRPGLWDLVKVLVTKEIPVDMLFFYSSGEALFPRTPDERRELAIPLLFSSAKRGINVGTSAVITILGDLTGDGRNDLVLRASETEIAVHAAREKERGFTDAPAFKIRTPNMEGYRFLEPFTDDLNGDGVDDLTIAYYSWDGKADRLSVHLSQGNPHRPAGAKGGASPLPPIDPRGKGAGGAGGPAPGTEPVTPAGSGRP